MKTNTIDLGYIHMSSYGPRVALTPSYCIKKGKRGVNPDEIVLAAGNYTLRISYPLDTPFKQPFTVKAIGMTRRQLVAFIIKMYKKVYADEEATEGAVLISPGGCLGLTVFGGHAMSDLILHTAEVRKNGTIDVDCDS